MGLLDGLLGQDSDLAPGEVDRQLAGVLAPGESVRVASRVLRDLMVFTDRRLILIDKQGMTGRKGESLTVRNPRDHRFLRRDRRRLRLGFGAQGLGVGAG